MTRATNKVRLTDAKVTTLGADPAKAARGNDTFHWDSGLPGFALKVTPRGTKVYVYIYKFNGKDRRMTFEGADEISASAAREKAKRADTLVRAGRDPQREKTEARNAQTVREHAAVWALHLERRVRLGEMKASTVGDYKDKMRLHLEPAFGSMKPADLTPTAIKAWRNRILAKAAKDTNERRLGVEGVNGALRVLSSFCGYLVNEAGVLTANPAKGLGQFATRQSGRSLLGDEAARLGAVLEKWRSRAPLWIAVIELAFFTGMRKSEALAVRWDEVDEGNGVIVLREHKTSIQTGALTKALNQEAREVLARAKAWRRDGNPHVFPSQTHKNIALVKSGKAPRIEDLHGHASEGGLKRAWTAIRKEAGLKDKANFRFHDIRHHHVTEGINSGVDPLTMSRTVGHKSPATTARYAHSAAETRQTASQQTSARIAGQLKAPTDNVVPLRLPVKA